MVMLVLGGNDGDDLLPFRAFSDLLSFLQLRENSLAVLTWIMFLEMKEKVVYTQKTVLQQ